MSLIQTSQVDSDLWWFDFFVVECSTGHPIIIFLIFFSFLSTFSKIYNKLINALEYLHKRTWLIHDDNTKQLLKELCPVDKLNFNFDLSELRWDVYFYIYMRGIRVYLLEDPLETIPKAQRKNLCLKIAHYTLCLVLATSTWKLFMSFAYDRLLGLL